MVSNKQSGGAGKSTGFAVEFTSAAATRPLRQSVLRPNQPSSELTYPGDDLKTTKHLAVKNHAGAIVSVASIYPEAQPDSLDQGGWRLRGMATNPDSRALGLASQLLAACREHIIQEGGAVLWCNARESAMEFYRKNQFRIIGERFEIEGIGPHYVMRRDYR